MSGSKLLAALAEAGEADLNEIRQQIEQTETTLASLRAAEQLLMRKIEGPRKRAPWGSKAKKPTPQADAPDSRAADSTPPQAALARPRSGGSGNKPSELAERIYDLIATKGSSTVEFIADTLGVQRQAVGGVVGRSSWFTRDRDGLVAIART